MGGSTLFQFLYEAYAQNLAQAATAEAVKILGAIAATAQGAVSIYVLILGKQMIGGAMTADLALTKLVRAVVVVGLMGAANFQTYVATPVTQTIPAFVSDVVTGQPGLQGAQGWDALENQVDHFAAEIDAQAIGISNIAERIVVGLIGVLATLTLGFGFFIWMLADAVVDLMVPIFAVTLPFYLFDATRGIAERTLFKIASLFLVMIVTLMIGQIVVYQDAQYLLKFTQNIAAAPPAAGFNMLPDINDLGLGPATTGDTAGSTLNVAAAIEAFWHALEVFTFGAFLLAICTGIALHIGGSAGFTTGPATRAIAVATRVAASTIKR